MRWAENTLRKTPASHLQHCNTQSLEASGCLGIVHERADTMLGFDDSQLIDGKKVDSHCQSDRLGC
jgi:hypothetical protein